MAAKKKKPKKQTQAPPGPEGLGPGQMPGQQQPSSADIIKQMKNTIKISIGDAEENILKIFDSVIAQLGAAAQQINKQAAHINALEGFLKDNNIPLDVVIPKAPGAKGPNRDTRRKMAKLAEKHKSKKSKTSK